ncbi:MAG: class I SAM-dependent methyltransferase [Steroidobacteraceae bacterium]
MHRTAMQNGNRFFATYGGSMQGATVIDIGSWGTSLRGACPPYAKYVGLDMIEGEGVDLVIDDPYKLPFADGSIDAVVSTSCFEHSEMFWLLYLEIMRVLKPAGLFYMCAPSNGVYHLFPVDCWRFYPDCGNALVKWGRKNGLNSAVLESYTSNQHLRETWNDFVCIFIKDENCASQHPKRILDSFADFSNGLKGPQQGKVSLLNPQKRPQDHRLYGWKLHKRVQKLGWYLRTGFGLWDPEARWKEGGWPRD